VFSTLHTNDAPQSISRILDSFPAATSRKCASSFRRPAGDCRQQLVPAADGINAIRRSKL